MKKRPAIYSRPNKPLFVPVPDRRMHNAKPEPLPDVQAIAVDRSTECHVTPNHVAMRMAGYIGNMEGLDILEPSAGTGNLAAAAILNGASDERLTLVEMHCTLAGLLKGHANVVNADFLEWSRGEGSRHQFDAVLMNPPFKKVRQHVAAARSLLKPGGRLVAIVPTTYQGLEVEVLEELPPDTFALAAVNTKIVYLKNE